MQVNIFSQLMTNSFLRVFAISAAASAPALAGTPTGSITFAPLNAATSVPTLGTAALILMALLLGFIGWASMRKKGPGALSSISLAAAVLAASSAGGLHWVQSADAGDGLVITDAGGESLEVYPLVLNTYTNNTSVPMQPTSIIYGTCAPQPWPSTCAVGTPVGPGDFCAINCQESGGNASDIRLKEGIVRVGTAANGLPLYEYTYRSDNTGAVYRGVMAQDVLLHTPAAVQVMTNGYFAVNYGMLDMELERVR